MSDPHPRWLRAKELFTAALDLPTAARESFLLRQGDDAAMVAEVRSLLAALPPTPGAVGEQSESGMADERPGACVGNYRLHEVIGEGGFGVVFSAEQEAPIRRRVAVKVIKPGMESKLVLARFEQERQALALMDHPNIARVFDGGSTPSGRPFFVMELVQGEPITDYCDRERLHPARRLRLVVDVARAVQHAHQRGFIHRDLKPSNVLVTVIDGQPVPKVIDFGVAKATEGRLSGRTLFTEHKQMLGTPLYMSPEQAQLSGVDVDTRSDVYSLGVLLYELLTGTTPFRKEDLSTAGMLEVVRVLREVDPPRPSSRISALGAKRNTIAAQRCVEPHRLGRFLVGDLDWIVTKCLAKERDRRYESAGDLARDIERHLGGVAVLAAPPSVGYRLTKFARRHRVQVAAALLVLVSVVVSIVVVVRQSREAADASARELVSERQSSAREAVHKARMHAAVGEWDLALGQLVRAEAYAGDPVAIALARIDAWEATGEVDRVEETLAGLRARADLGEHADMVELLWCDPSRRRPDVAPTIEWRGVLRQLEGSPGLDPAWRKYAQALGAETMPRAVVLLDEALHIAPRHRRAAELRLWLVMLMRGPEAALQAARLFRQHWPRDEYGRVLEAASLDMLGRAEDSARLIAALERAEARELVATLGVWHRKTAGLVPELIDRIGRSGSMSVQFSTLMLACLEGASKFREAEARIGRVHPLLHQLGPQVMDALKRVPGAFVAKSSDGLQPYLDRCVATTGFASLKVASAIVKVFDGNAQEGLRALFAREVDEGDFFLSRREVRTLRIVMSASAAFGMAKLQLAGNVLSQADTELKAFVQGEVAILIRSLPDLSLEKVRYLTELVSLVGGEWPTLECVGHLMARPGIGSGERLAAARCCLRIRSGNLVGVAEQILRQLQVERPDDKDVRALAKRLEDLRSGVVDPAQHDSGPPKAR